MTSMCGKNIIFHFSLLSGESVGMCDGAIDCDLVDIFSDFLMETNMMNTHGKLWWLPQHNENTLPLQISYVLIFVLGIMYTI